MFLIIYTYHSCVVKVGLFQAKDGFTLSLLFNSHFIKIIRKRWNMHTLRLGGIMLTECGITHLHKAGEYHSILPINDTNDFS